MLLKSIYLSLLCFGILSSVAFGVVQKYTVVSGDGCWSITDKLCGCGNDYASVITVSCSALKVGQEIDYSCSGCSGGASVTTTTPSGGSSSGSDSGSSSGSTGDKMTCAGDPKFPDNGAGSLLISWDKDWSTTQPRCKLVKWQMPWSALNKGDYEKCVQNYYPGTQVPAGQAEQILASAGEGLMPQVMRSIQTLPNEEVEQVSPGRSANPFNVKLVEEIFADGAKKYNLADGSAFYDYIFAVRNEAYSLSNFLKAISKFPALCGEYTDGRDSKQICRKVLATMFAHFGQETGAHAPNWPQEEWRQGLYWITENGYKDTQSGAYNACTDDGTSATWAARAFPCGTFQNWCNTDANHQKQCQEAGNPSGYLSYYGRGAKQLSWNYNYGPFSQAMFGDVTTLLNNPELVANTWLNLASATFFFTYPQPPKPSMLFVIDGTWVPNAADKAAGITTGFGATTNIINGGIECQPFSPGQEDARSKNRIKYYKSFLDVFDLNGDNSTTGPDSGSNNDPDNGSGTDNNGDDNVDSGTDPDDGFDNGSNTNGGDNTGSSDCYTVVEGDGLWNIAEELCGCGNRWAQIFNLSENKISIGQELCFDCGKCEDSPVDGGDNEPADGGDDGDNNGPDGTDGGDNGPDGTDGGDNGPVDGPDNGDDSNSDPKDDCYTVRSGDGCWNIAQDLCGCGNSYEDVLPGCQDIQPGQQICPQCDKCESVDGGDGTDNWGDDDDNTDSGTGDNDDGEPVDNGGDEPVDNGDDEPVDNGNDDNGPDGTDGGDNGPVDGPDNGDDSNTDPSNDCYTVRAGDGCWNIAQDLCGCGNSYEDVLPGCASLQAGQQICPQCDKCEADGEDDNDDWVDNGDDEDNNSGTVDNGDDEPVDNGDDEPTDNGNDNGDSGSSNGGCVDIKLGAIWGTAQCGVPPYDNKAYCAYEEFKKKCCQCGGGSDGSEPVDGGNNNSGCQNKQLPVVWGGNCDEGSYSGLQKGLGYCQHQAFKDNCCNCQ